MHNLTLHNYRPLEPTQLQQLMVNRPKPENALSIDDLIAKVVATTFTLVRDSKGALRKTVADLELDNGFQLSGESVVVDPQNYNQELGQHFAFMDAINKLWVPMAFHLKELASQGVATIVLSKAEVESGLDRVKWAEGLIRQLPEDHEGRNSWLMNYGKNGVRSDLVAAGYTVVQRSMGWQFVHTVSAGAAVEYGPVADSADVAWDMARVHFDQKKAQSNG